MLDAFLVDVLPVPDSEDDYLLITNGENDSVVSDTELPQPSEVPFQYGDVVCLFRKVIFDTLEKPAHLCLADAPQIA